MMGKARGKEEEEDCRVGIFFLPFKIPQARMPSWHPPDSDSGSVKYD